MKVKTQILQEMLTKAVRGSVPNKMLPITGLIGIKNTEDDKLVLITTDGTNYLYVSHNIDETSNLDISVDVEKFSKLISKFTSEDVVLDVNDGVLKIIGNGQYKMGLELDDNQEIIKYPDPVKKAKLDNPISVATEDIRSVLQFNKPALAVASDDNCYGNYFIDNNSVISTDSFKLCGNGISVNVESPILIAPNTMELLANVTDENITLTFGEGVVCFTSSDITVYSVNPNGVEDYTRTVGKVRKVIDTDLTSNCRVSKTELISLLERVSLFVGPYDKNIITLEFTEDCIEVSSKDNSAVDTIEYKEAQDTTPYTCNLDVSMFLSLIKSQTSDYLNIYYGKSDTGVIKLVDGDVSQVLALAVN